MSPSHTDIGCISKTNLQTMMTTLKDGQNVN